MLFGKDGRCCAPKQRGLRSGRQLQLQHAGTRGNVVLPWGFDGIGEERDHPALSSDSSRTTLQQHGTSITLISPATGGWIHTTGLLLLYSPILAHSLAVCQQSQSASKVDSLSPTCWIMLFFFFPPPPMPQPPPPTSCCNQ